MSEKELKSNPLETRVSVLEIKVQSIEDCIKILMAPKNGVLMQLEKIKGALKFWPKLIGVCVTIMTIIVSVVEVLKAFGF